MDTLIQVEYISRMVLDPCLLCGYLIVLVRALYQKCALMILLGLLGVISQISFIVYDVYLHSSAQQSPPPYVQILVWETLAMSLSMTGNAIFTFKYWTISLIIQHTLEGVDHSQYEHKLNAAFYSFAVVNAISPIVFNVVLAFYSYKGDTQLRPFYRLIALCVYLAMLGSYLLLADALRRLYSNLKAKTDVVLNIRLIFVYFGSTIFYFICLAVAFGLFMSSGQHYFVPKAIIGQLLCNLASYIMQSLMIVIYWNILVNMPRK
jgi:hypothetical protein